MASISLAPKQVQLMIAVIAQLGTVQVDWKVVAEAADFKTAKYARDTWTTVRNKILADTGAKLPVMPETPKANGGGGGKKRKPTTSIPADEEGDGDEEPEVKKTKSKKSRAKKVKKEIKEEDEGEGEGEGELGGLADAEGEEFE